MKLEEIDIAISFLEKKKLLSVRASNACRRMGIYKLNQIIAHYISNNSFKCWGCGTKSEAEIMNLCKMYMENSDEVIENYKLFEEQAQRKLQNKKKTDVDIKDIPELKLINSFEATIIDRLVKYNISLYSTLSVRAYNGLMRIYKNRSLNEFIKTIYAPNFQFRDLSKIGDKTEIELNQYKAKLSRFVYTISNELN